MQFVRSSDFQWITVVEGSPQRPVGPVYDRETTPEYFLTIMATDGGGATSTTRVHVTLDDVNDQHPVFLRPEYRAFLKENSNNFDVGVTAQVGTFYFYTYFCTLSKRCQHINRCECCDTKIAHHHSERSQFCVSLGVRS